MSGKADTEADLPEADRLEGFAPPRHVSEFFGNQEAEQTLLDSFSSNRLHHAWLLAGPEGIGKATLAYRFARFLLAQTEDSGAGQASDHSIPSDHPVFSQVGALAHPNLLVLRRPWLADRKRLATVITISEARRLKRFFGHTAGAGRWRVVIIDRADELSVAAANALLKSLEEPPARCVFFLVCSSPGRLPVTIRSRCRTLRFSTLNEADLEKAVLSAYGATDLEKPSLEAMSSCMPLAMGSVGRAIRLLESGGNKMHSRLVNLITSLPRLDYGAVHDLADEISGMSAGGSYELFFDLAGEVLARIVSHAATGEGAHGSEAQFAERVKGPHALAQWAQLWETIQRDKAEADALNLDRKNLVLGTFFRLEETARLALH